MVAHAEQDDGDRNPGDGADGAQHLQHGIDDLVGGRIPAERQAQGNSDHDGGAEADGHAAQGIDDIAPQHAFADQLGDSLLHIAAATERLWWRSRRRSNAIAPERARWPAAARRTSPTFLVRRGSSYLVRQTDLLEDSVAQFQIARRADVARDGGYRC